MKVSICSMALSRRWVPDSISNILAIRFSMSKLKCNWSYVELNKPYLVLTVFRINKCKNIDRNLLLSLAPVRPVTVSDVFSRTILWHCPRWAMDIICIKWLRLVFSVIFRWYGWKYVFPNCYSPSSVCCFILKLFVLDELELKSLNLVLLSKQYIQLKEFWKVKKNFNSYTQELNPHYSGCQLTILRTNWASWALVAVCCVHTFHMVVNKGCVMPGHQWWK